LSETLSSYSFNIFIYQLLKINTMVKGVKAPSSSGTSGKTPAPNPANKGGKPRQQDEKAIDETVSHI
jgi:hypothetical protein